MLYDIRQTFCPIFNFDRKCATRFVTNFIIEIFIVSKDIGDEPFYLYFISLSLYGNLPQTHQNFLYYKKTGGFSYLNFFFFLYFDTP